MISLPLILFNLVLIICIKLENINFVHIIRYVLFNLFPINVSSLIQCGSFFP